MAPAAVNLLHGANAVDGLSPDLSTLVLLLLALMYFYNRLSGRRMPSKSKNKKLKKPRIVKTNATPIRGRPPRNFRGSEEQLVKDSVKTVYMDQNLKDEAGNPASAADFGVAPENLRLTEHGLPIEPLTFKEDGAHLRGCEGRHPRPVGWELLGDQPGEYDPSLLKVPTAAEGGTFWTTHTDSFNPDNYLPNYFAPPHDDPHFMWMFEVSHDVVGFERLQNLVPLIRRVQDRNIHPKDFYESLETELRARFNDLYYTLSRYAKVLAMAFIFPFLWLYRFSVFQILRLDCGTDRKLHQAADGSSAPQNWIPLGTRVGHRFDGGAIDVHKTMKSFGPIANFINPASPPPDANSMTAESYCRGRTLNMDGSSSLDHHIPRYRPMDGSVHFPFKPTTGAWLSEDVDDMMKVFLGFRTQKEVSAFFARLSKEKSPEDVIKKLGSLSETRSSDSGASDLSLRTPTKDLRIVLSDVGSPSTPEGEYHTSLASEYSNERSNTSTASVDSSIFDRTTPRRSTPPKKTITLTQMVRAYGDHQKPDVIVLSSSSEDEEETAPPPPSPVSADKTLTPKSSPKSSPESPPVAPATSTSKENDSSSFLRESPNNCRTFSDSDSDAVEDAIANLTSSLRRRLGRGGDRCRHRSSPPSLSSLSSSEMSSEDPSLTEIKNVSLALKQVTKELKPKVLHTPPTERFGKRKFSFSSPDNALPQGKRLRRMIGPLTEQDQFAAEADELDQRDRNRRDQVIRDLQCVVPFPASSHPDIERPQMEFERLAAGKVVDFFGQGNDESFTRLLKQICSSSAGNSAVDKARVAIIRFINCFKKLELPKNVIPQLDESQDDDLRLFIQKIITDVADRIIEKTHNAGHSLSRNRSPTAARVTFKNPSFIVWESPELAQISEETNEATTETTGCSSDLPSAILTPPVFTSSPMSPDSTTAGQPQASSMWAGSLRSRCANRSRCIAVTPTQGPSTPTQGPMIVNAGSILQHTFDQLPASTDGGSDINTEAIMAVMSAIHEMDEDHQEVEDVEEDADADDEATEIQE